MRLFDEHRGEQRHYAVRPDQLPRNPANDRKQAKTAVLEHLRGCPRCSVTDHIDGCETYRALERRWAEVCMNAAAEVVSVHATCRSCLAEAVAESRAKLDDAGWMFDDDITCNNFDLTGFCPACVVRDAGN